MTCTAMMIAGAQAEARELRAELDRLRAENKELRNGDWQRRFQVLAIAMTKVTAEIDRLRAEVAELREALFNLIEVADAKAGMPWKPIDKARAILAKTAPPSKEEQ